MSARRGITILGSTGSIGCNTVELVEASPDLYRVEALVANSRVDTLADQARRLNARLAVVADESAYPALKEALAGTGIEVAAGAAAVADAADLPADWVMASIVGAAGLAPTLRAIRRGATVGLANKEVLVCAGQLMMAEVKTHGATLLPVDSEHSAIFQVLDVNQHDQVEKIILTASGGPFRGKSREFMSSVTPEQAVAHPNWSMGAKISVDSASMFNKGLELIEAYHLFNMPEEKIDIVVHPQSVIHSLVAYTDGSVLAQLGSPDMRTPIAYALGWPNRIPAPVPRLDLAAIGTLIFEAPNETLFPSLRLAREALRAGGSVAAVLNAANEVSVAAFLARKIGFLDIARVVERTIEGVNHRELLSIDDVLAQDQVARRFAESVIGRL
ncbi:1-deoxy-D-xylulose-5-phosphate reductoisomerase [Magnetospirillum molischianum]|uniref:1-deoxy-D-xylulose 5-phosphate reductoisomerase n=1 Tax=Magnetospirillum molischianum DSM 120 TaxID=1150626 RepID=H8FRA7_MAGML|nr:1-deoxy-D-xylulose-5-phosphate reductoisomerase [Magnetospirillum molischianum]CCG40895.1 1-deoxy-D-xylulose 5-phosphate reductoisomerase (DXP reductoisomerase) (1-deoxyxylulose-5-phosphate reductoisomerase) [Magnetospirillum molischianum DSM 120]